MKVNKAIIVGLTVMLLLVYIPMTAISEDEALDLNLPTDSVMLSVSHPGADAYFDSTLSMVPSGYDVMDGVYGGWCIQRDEVMPLDSSFEVNLSNGYSIPPLDSGPECSNWNKANYIVNIRDQYDETAQDVQNIMWYYLDGGAYPTSSEAQAMIDDADENGSCFIPDCGEIVLVICDAGDDIQASVIEVPVICTEQVELTINIFGNGSVDADGTTIDPPSGTKTYNVGDTVHLIATADLDWSFSDWSGDYVGASPSISFLIFDDLVVNATFIEDISPKYTVTVGVNGPGTTSNPAPGSYLYPEGSEISVDAIPDSGADFIGWTGDLTGMDNPLNFTVDDNVSIVANFEDSTVYYELTMIVEGSGSTIPSVGTHVYEEGTVVDLEAIADVDWEFNHWEGDISGTSNQTSITMDSNKTVIANFTMIDTSVTLTLNINGGGNVEVDTNDGTFYATMLTQQYDVDIDTCITLTAIPVSVGAEFSHWIGDVSNTSNMTTIVCMDEDKEVTAVFDCGCGYMLTVDVVGSGEVVQDPHRFCYSTDGTEQVELTAVPEEGWAFYEWTGNVSGRDNPITLTMDEDKSVTAIFIDDPASLNVTVVGEGSVLVSPEYEYYANGTVVSIDAFADSGWVFDHWGGDISGSENPRNISVIGEMEITAYFTEAFDLTIGINGDGTTDPAAGVHPYVNGSSVTVTANASVHWEFSHWSGDVATNDSENLSITLVMDEDKSIVAVFSQVECELTIEVASGEGTTDPAPGSYFYDVGTVVDLEAIADSGWEFDHWGGGASGTSATTTVTMSSDKSVSAYFVEVDPADLECSGALYWSDVPAGDTVSGVFDVLNTGGESLSWEIESYPEDCGEWTFTPSSGVIEPGESVTVSVSLITPDARALDVDAADDEYTGEVKVVNSDDSGDFDTVPVSLTTPVSPGTSLLQQVIAFIVSLVERFPMLQRLVEAVPFFANFLGL